MRPEDRHLIDDFGGDPRRPLLVHDGEPVAGLGLHAGCALCQRLGQVPPQRRRQRDIGGLAGRRDRVHDPAGGIAAAGAASGEFRGPVSREAQMGVAVHPAGQHRTAFDVDRDRTQSQNVGLGYGVHSCLGAALARMESTVALNMLMDFMPRYEVLYDELERVFMTNVAGWSRVPVRVLR